MNEACENGCVGDSRSPGAGSPGTGRSSTGMTGLPVRRSSTKRIAGLGRLHQRRHRFAADRQIDQRRLRRNVHVPEIMVDRLEHPLELSGGAVERDDAARELLRRGWPWRHIGRPRPCRRERRSSRACRRPPRCSSCWARTGCNAGPRRGARCCPDCQGRNSTPACPSCASNARTTPRRHLDRHVVEDAAGQHDEPARDQRRRGELVPALWYSRHSRAHSLTWPPVPKSAHGRPLIASSAISRASLVATKIRVLQSGARGAIGGAPGAAAESQ